MTTRLFDEQVPVSGEIQFWRVDPRRWAAVLDATLGLGIRHVATYLSWRRHEPVPGVVDFSDPRWDVRRFLALCRERDIGVQVKPGPWICAEEPGGGLPDWVLDNDGIMARDHAGRVVLGYNPPFRHPVPSYASEEYRRLVTGWYAAVVGEIGDLLAPGGVVEAVQLDNEPSAAFQDAMFRSDYSPPALARFRDFVIARHGSAPAARRAWGLVAGDPADIEPPRPGASASQQHRSDWIAFQEHYISDYLAFLRGTLADLGVRHAATVVNLNTHPVRGLPQSGERIVGRLRQATDHGPIVVGEDHYFEPPIDEGDLMQLELGAALGIASGTDLVWSPELQAGIWRSPGEVVRYPDPLDGELAAWWGLALAYGYQGFNLYMLADRENWQYAPLGRDGHATPGAGLLDELLRTLGAIPELRAYRPVPAVNLVWDRQVLERAFAAVGTQAEPVEPWTDSAATRDWHETLQIARRLTAAGLPYRLCRTPGDLVADLPTYGPEGLGEHWRSAPLRRSGDLPPAPIAAEEAGVAVRRLVHPGGAEIVVAVAWRRRDEGGAVSLRRAEGWPGGLTDCATGATYRPVEGSIRVPMPALGVRVFRVAGAS